MFCLQTLELHTVASNNLIEPSIVLLVILVVRIPGSTSNPAPTPSNSS